ncbi:MAG: hypothetical protein H6673_05890 [Anaerolineales bacterium]|nr:hypothetical protein [Anaerolineales bacterium]
MTTEQLTVMALGGLRVLRVDQDVAFETRKEAALFVYLLGTARPHPREALAEMFWEGYSQSDALRNLRRMLCNLRHGIGDFLLAPRGDFVSINMAANIRFDFAELEDCLLSGTETLTEEHVVRLQTALNLYRGGFLEGFYVDSSEFERWMVAERNRLVRRVVQGLHLLANYDLQQQRYDRGIETVSHLLMLDDLDEEAHRLYMVLLALSGQRVAALRHYQVCCDILEKAFGIAPEQETERFYQRILAGEKPVSESIQQTTSISMAAGITPNNLPSHLTAFVGRKSERQELRKLIEQSAARLITIVGLGGVGKSRLALKVAEDVMEGFSDGVFLVGLTTVKVIDQLIPVIAATINLDFNSGESPSQALKTFLADKKMLLVLDNFEHLLGSAELVAELLMAAPNLYTLITSRDVLYLRGETLFPLDGLGFVRADLGNTVSQTDATQLFLQSARRSNPAFTLATEEAELVGDICWMVRGMPLALELAASWVSLLTLGEIRDEIVSGIDLLSTEQINTPERHRSIRTIFEATWQRLNAGEQEMLLRLSTFRNGFSRQAAQQVAGASLGMLNILLSKSLIFRMYQTRYEIHQLLQHYLQEKLQQQPDLLAETNTNHAHYYASFIIEHESSIIGGNYQIAVADFENIQQAWHTAIDQLDWVSIEQLREGLWALFDAQSRLQDGANIFQQAVQALEMQTEPVARVQYGRCLALYGYFLGRTGKMDVGYKLARQGVILLHELNAYEAYILSASVLAELATTETQQFEARNFIETNLDLLEKGSITRIGSVLWRYARLLNAMGDSEDAEKLLVSAAAREQERYRPRGQANIDWQHGHIHYCQGKHLEAHERLLKSLQEYRELNYEQGVAWALNTLGHNACQMSRLEEAAHHFLGALQAAQQANLDPIIFDSLVGLGEIMRQRGYSCETVVTTSFVLSQHTLNPDTKTTAQALLQTMQPHLEETDLRASQQQGRQADLSHVVALVRQVLLLS